jgi:manganese transport protein
MKKILGITLGIMTALGGFVDLGQIVFTMQAGALFRYQLLWTIVLGTIGIILYMEMCGRVAVVAWEPVFAIVRTQLGFPLGLATLIASNLLNLLTCAAEIGGLAILLRLLTGWPERILLLLVVLFLVVGTGVLKFQWIERIFGLSGLAMIVFAVSATVLHPNWHQAAAGLLPTVAQPDTKHFLVYAYFAVGIFSALLMEYEVHFYSSGAMEEDWKAEDLGENFAVAAFGSLLGALLTIALLFLGAIVFLPRGIFPNTLSTTVLAGALPFGPKTLVLAIFGAGACLAGAAVETALSGAYNICQFFNLPWGKSRPWKQVRTFTIVWVSMFAVAFVIAAVMLAPLKLVDLSIVFGMVVLPLTYYPILKTAADKKIMGRHANSRLITVLGIIFLILITVAALAAIPLMLVTHSGQPPST